jgi:tetratricopeptide (TPR) repeat protein
MSEPMAAGRVEDGALAARALALDRLVLRCLAKRPERRYPSFAALRPELEACYTSQTGYAPILPRADDAREENAAALAAVEMAWAISLVTLGRYDEAMTYFDLAVEHDPSLARAWYFRGLALNDLGRFDEALECLNRVVRLHPRDANAWVEQGRSLTRAGRDRQPVPAQWSWEPRQGWPDPRSGNPGAPVNADAPAPQTRPSNEPPPPAAPPPTIWPPAPAPVMIPPPPTSPPRPQRPLNGPDYGLYTGPDGDVDLRP